MTVALSRDYHRCIVLVLLVLLLLVFSFSGAICSRFLERTNWEATDVHETELQGRWQMRILARNEQRAAFTHG